MKNRGAGSAILMIIKTEAALLGNCRLNPAESFKITVTGLPADK